MLLPEIDDTIVAVSSGWTPSAVGIVRLSGPKSHQLLDSILTSREVATSPPVEFPARLAIDERLILPANVLLFSAPHSYTGQDVAEIHTVGCLPALRELCTRLIELGARRALPGEFTARAYLAGKLAADQVDTVLSLINAEDSAAARALHRASQGRRRSSARELTTRLKDLLALIEAGIDFVDEEDVRFISSAEIRSAVSSMQDVLSEWREASSRAVIAARPHVSLVGLPNAGKSTLFNTLIGSGRAIVSPVIGTTRDVISAETNVGIAIVLQDCAGLGLKSGDLEAAAHLAAEEAAEQSDLVLWVHDRAQAWDALETSVCRSIPIGRRILVQSKLDIESARADAEVAFREVVDVSCATGEGIENLRALIGRCLEAPLRREPPGCDDIVMREIDLSLARVLELTASDLWDLKSSELIALELRVALDALGAGGSGELPDDVLARIFGQFCVGK